MNDNDTVKELLGRAFGEEPPLRIDRDEVVQQGRKRLRRRRFFEAGGVVAAVLVAVVGAATLTNLSGTEPERLPPAASRTPPPPTSTSPVPTTSEPQLAPPTGTPTPGTGYLDPTRLLKVLYESGVVTEKDVQVVLGQPGGPRFEQSGDQFVYEADVIRPRTPGSLHVVVDFAPGTRPDCRVSEPYDDCEMTSWNGVPMALARYVSPSGQRGTYASAVLDNGIRVVATTTNLTSYDARSTPAGRPPALTDDELFDLVVKVGEGAG